MSALAPPDRHVLHVFPSFLPGGAQVRAAQILGLWSRHRHSILALDGRTECAKKIPESVRYELLPPPPRAGSWAMGKALAARVRELAPDLVMTYNWGSTDLLLGLRWRREPPVVHHEDGFGPEEATRFLKRRIWLRRLLLPRAKALIVPSQVLAGIARELWRQPARRVHCLPNGVDLAHFRPRDVPRSGTEVVFGTVGGLRAEKHQDLMLRAFAKCRYRDRARLLMVGSGPMQEPLQQLTHELGLQDRVQFPGFRDDTATAYAEMDVFVMSSRTEQMPIVVVEAMACGLPVVSTDVGDVRRMVADQNLRWIVPRDDVQELARTFDEAILESDARSRLGAANRARAEQEYEIATCYGRFIAVYEQAMAAAN